MTSHKPASLASFFWRRLELRLTGPLPHLVRQNMRIELGGAMAFGVFHAAVLAFVPVVLQHLGATPTMQALYLMQTYLGMMLTTFSILLMRRRRTKNFAVLFWFISRGLFLLAFFITQAGWFLVLTTIFWLIETFPSPAYARIAQKIYPARHRGQIMAVVRIGMSLTVLLVTPLAGWALDEIGYRVLFPLAALLGLFSTWRFACLKIDEGQLPPRQPRSLTMMWRVIGEDRRFGIFLLALSIYGIGALVGAALYPMIQVDQLHLSYSQIGLLGFVQSTCWLLGYLYWGRLIDRRGALWVVRANFIIYAIVPFSYMWATNVWWLLPASIAQGLVSAGADLGFLNAGLQLAEPERVDEYSAIQSTIIGLRGLAGPVLGLALLSLGLPQRAIFAIGCLLILLSALIIHTVVRSRPAGQPSRALT